MNNNKNKKRPEHLFPAAQGRNVQGGLYDPRYHLNSETFYGSIPQNLSALMVQDFFGPIPFSVTGEPGEAYLPSGDGFGPRLREGFGTSSAKAFTGRLLSAASEMLTVSFQRLLVKKE